MTEKEIKHIYFETELNNWSDIFKLNQRFLTKFIYRGQANEKWDLSTSLERQTNILFPNLIDKSAIPLQEKEMIKEFQWKYPLYSTNGPDHKNHIEWLTIMQHYGSATRLLDFSKSIFVAIFMAVTNGEENSALWAINKIPINHQIFDKYCVLKNVKSVGADTLNKYSIELANDIIIKQSFKNNIKKQLFIINPQMCNERLSRQQGLFIMPSDIKCTFNECISTYLYSPESIKIKFDDLVSYSNGNESQQDDISIIKIIIPKYLNFKILKYLREMNVTSEILFPGLEGLAKSVNYQRFSFDREND